MLKKQHVFTNMSLKVNHNVAPIQEMYRTKDQRERKREEEPKRKRERGGEREEVGG